LSGEPTSDVAKTRAKASAKCALAPGLAGLCIV
jgi:hypothetical protein